MLLEVHYIEPFLPIYALKNYQGCLRADENIELPAVLSGSGLHVFECDTILAKSTKSNQKPSSHRCYRGPSTWSPPYFAVHCSVARGSFPFRYELPLSGQSKLYDVIKPQRSQPGRSTRGSSSGNSAHSLDHQSCMASLSLVL